jgi:predicted acetyltransferase
MCDNTQLIRPSPELSKTHGDFIQEFRQRREPLVPWVLGLDRSDFPQYVKRLNDFSTGIGLQPGFVEHTTYWLVEHDKVLLGVSNLRHRLTPALQTKGGHIGFGVRPSQRQRGHATRLLALTLLEARSLGIDRVLLTCDKDNAASARVILRNGGILDTETTGSDDHTTLRYWIDLT